MRSVALLFALLLLSSGCPYQSEPSIELYAVTAAPVARTATITETDEVRRIDLSTGVVLGIGCWESCEGACLEPTFRIEHPDLLSVRPLFRQTDSGQSWGLVAAGAGATRLTVETACASQSYTVQIRSSAP